MIPSATDSASHAGIEPRHDDMDRPSNRVGFAWWGTGVFLALGIARAWRHEPWRDECNILQLATDTSFGELLFCLRYECHPYFWAVFAWCLAQFTTHPFALPLVHVVLASSAAFVVLR